MDKSDNQIAKKNRTVDFSTKTWKENLTLTVEGKPIYRYVCKQVMALVSPVFDAMFGGDFKEKKPKELLLPGKNHAAFCEFLKCVYPNMLHHVTLSNVHEILPLAEEYQVLRLKTECETCLLNSLSENTSAEELYSLLMSAHLYNLETLKARTIALLINRSQEDLDKAGAEVTLPPDLEKELRERMIRILKAKSSQMAEEMKTLAALNGCLVATEKENEIMSEYTKGKWKGGSTKFEVYLKGDLDEEIDIHVSSVEFTLKLFKRYSEMCMSLSSTYSNYVKIMGMVIVNNWMAGKKNKVVFFKENVSPYSSSTEYKIGSLYDLAKETHGYIYDGKVKVDLHIFLMDKL